MGGSSEAKGISFSGRQNYFNLIGEIGGGNLVYSEIKEKGEIINEMTKSLLVFHSGLRKTFSQKGYPKKLAMAWVI